MFIITIGVVEIPRMVYLPQKQKQIQITSGDSSEDEENLYCFYRLRQKNLKKLLIPPNDRYEAAF